MEYVQKIEDLQCTGGTDFLPVFEKIGQIIREHPNVTEVYIVFVTDG